MASPAQLAARKKFVEMIHAKGLAGSKIPVPSAKAQNKNSGKGTPTGNMHQGEMSNPAVPPVKPNTFKKKIVGNKKVITAIHAKTGKRVQYGH